MCAYTGARYVPVPGCCCTVPAYHIDSAVIARQCGESLVVPDGAVIHQQLCAPCFVPCSTLLTLPTSPAQHKPAAFCTPIPVCCADFRVIRLASEAARWHAGLVHSLPAQEPQRKHACEDHSPHAAHAAGWGRSPPLHICRAILCCE